MSEPANEVRDELKEIGPLGQSVTLAFRFLFLVACAVAIGWLVSNFHQIPADSQAVIIRFGSVARVQGAGLLIAWPRPIERVVMLPGPARQLQIPIDRFVMGANTDAHTSVGFELNPDPRLNYGFLLAGDVCDNRPCESVVHLEAQVFYQITDPVAYMIAAEHVTPALQRLFIASAIATMAGRDLDSILVARPEIASQANEVNRRELLRTDLVIAVNRRLARLADAGASLGIQASRVDLVPSIPAGAKYAFDNVLVVSQQADTAIAAARTAAQTTALNAERIKDRIATSATASAEELQSAAQTQTAEISAYAGQAQGMSRDMQMTRLYYDRVQTLLKQAGQVMVVDSKGAIRTIIPGQTPTEATGAPP